MANILDLLRKKNPNMTLDDARSAMGIPAGNTFDMFGNQVPTQDNTIDPLPTLSPMRNATPFEPQIYNESYDPIASLDIERNPKEPFNPFQSANAPKPSPSIPRQKSTQPRAETPAKDFKLPQDDIQEINEQNKAEQDKLDLENTYRKEDQEALSSTPDDLDQLLRQQSEVKSEPTLQDKFKDAQAHKRKMEDMAMWTKIGAQIGGGLGHQSKDVIKSNMDLADIATKRGDLPMQQLKEEIAFASEDPQSEYSNSLRDFLNTKFGMELPDTISGAQIDKSFSGLGLKTFEADKAREEAKRKQELDLQNKKELQDIRQEDKLEQIKAMAEMNAPMRELMLNERQASREMRERIAKTGKINTAAQKMAYGSGSSYITRLYNDNLRAEKVFTTIGLDPKISEKELDAIPIAQLDKEQKLKVMELATELNGLLSGSNNPAASSLNKLIPANIQMHKTKVKDFITSELNGANQGSFVKEVAKIARRVKENSKTKVMEIAKKSFGPLSGFAKDKDPEVQEMYRNTLYMNGLDPEDFEEEIKSRASGLKDKAAKNKEAKSPGLDAKLKAVDTMSEEELDKELAKRGIK